MRRREFIAGLGGAVAWPFTVRAQQPAVPVIGLIVLGSATQEGIREALSAFHHGLSETGYVEGQNVAIEYRWADNHYDRLPALADDLVRRRVSVIVALGAAGAVAAKRATNSIPIVFAMGADPVDAGLVASLNRPGGNLTGLYNLNIAVVAKRLELLHEIAAWGDFVRVSRQSDQFRFC